VDRAIQEQYTSSSEILTPSAEEARAFNDRLDTVTFRHDVIVDAGLAPLVESLQWPQPVGPASWLDNVGLKAIGKKLGGTPPENVQQAWSRAEAALLSSLKVQSKGDNLIVVTYSGPDKENAQALVNAATANYLEEKANAAQRKVDESNRVHDPLVSALEQEVETARQAWVNFSASLPVTPTEAQSQQEDELEAVYKDGLARLDDMKLNRAAAILAAVTEWTNTTPNATLVDAPDSPASLLGMFALAKYAVMAAFVGTFIGAVLVVFRTWLDRDLRIPEDVEARLEAPVLAVLPLIGPNRTEFGRGR
jgi:capsular polysaccharide biosynthesis protein